jgi:tyrosinase
MKPHCLSRKFNRPKLSDRWANTTSPEFIDGLMKSETFEKFFLKLEVGGHNAIPAFIGGDFDYETAPNGKSKRIDF